MRALRVIRAIVPLSEGYDQIEESVVVVCEAMERAGVSVDGISFSSSGERHERQIAAISYSYDGDEDPYYRTRQHQYEERPDQGLIVECRCGRAEEHRMHRADARKLPECRSLFREARDAAKR